MDKVKNVKDGGSHRKIGQSPTKSSSLHIRAKSSFELARKFKQIKKEKIDKLHEQLQGNNRVTVQEVIEVVEETPKKQTDGNNGERVQKIDGNLNKHNATKKLERPKLRQLGAMKDFTHRDKEVVQGAHGKTTDNGYGNSGERVLKVDGNLDKRVNSMKMERPKLQKLQSMEDYTPVEQGMLKKRTHEKSTIDGLGENLLDSNRGKFQKVDKTAGKKILFPSTKRKKPDKPNLSVDTMMSNTQCSKKAKRVPTCPSMLIDDFIELQKSKELAATNPVDGEIPCNNIHPSSSQPLKVSKSQPLSSKNREDLRQQEVMKSVAQVYEDINEEINPNGEKEKGTPKRKTRGKTLCKRIHARTMEDREEVTFNDNGQPIGPTERVVSDLSLFLGTLARSSSFCPLIYTSWSGMPDRNIKRFWKYTNQKFILPNEAEDWVEKTVRDAWRRYKHKIKKNHFLKYSNMTERLKHRPPKVPEVPFKKLCEYWSWKPVQLISERNTRNRAQQKWRHVLEVLNFIYDILFTICAKVLNYIKLH